MILMKSSCIFYFVALISAATTTCDKYECARFSTSDQCSSIKMDDTTSTIRLQPCSDSLVCPLELKAEPDTCKRDLELNPRYPGEYCEHAFECHSKKCFKNKCKGFYLNSSCNNSTECELGLYCNAKHTCVRTSTKGHCDESESCGPFAVCNMNKCVDIASLDEGKPANVSAACESFYIFDRKCAKAPKLVWDAPVTGPVVCKDTCRYISSDSIKFTESCRCGMTSEGKSFCNPGTGNFDISDVILC
eukprot:TRINITY_DN3599_c0_g4_i1.p1 TRINITY_DN3599_c0_g4~~TRINITY_DN3599_c0_g4_i1.p1  ORF type:complete len:280 (+),score=-3.80 TRINITY_DN3599_c0_g4_i1:102-842(+)